MRALSAALCAIALTVLALAAPTSAATGALVGHAALTSPGCALPDVTYFFGTNVQGNLWKVQVDLGCATPKLLFDGFWDPAQGGCIEGTSVTGQFCIGPIPVGVPTFTVIVMCIGQTCQSAAGEVELA